MSIVDPGAQTEPPAENSSDEDVVARFARASRDYAQFGTPPDARKASEPRPSIDDLNPSSDFRTARNEARRSFEEPAYSSTSPSSSPASASSSHSIEHSSSSWFSSCSLL